jgi:uncharacterized membrane protein YidH (DUF202 family)
MDRDDQAALGLQAERTLLAWNRTALALLVASALLLRAGDTPYLALRHLPAVFGLVVGAGLFLHGDRSYRRIGGVHATRRPAPLGAPRALFLLAATTIVLGLTATVVIALP